MPELDAQISGPEQAPAPAPLFQTAILVSLAVAILCLFLFAWLGREMLAGDTLRLTTPYVPGRISLPRHT